MELNWSILVIVGVLLLALVIFTIVRNQKDEKDLENKLNNDYRKPQEHTDADDPDDVKGS
ncbi:MAG TPA: hypothetical protein VEZ55_14290 [Chitinophagaceae bacterium]|jgi:protein-S-isoprenylcysteine O-methyltransferase Ste14|nr:hypothetical protein [Chitinophagaceae bacterium]